MICAETDEEAQAQFADVKWFWDKWPEQFGQGMRNYSARPIARAGD